MGRLLYYARIKFDNYYKIHFPHEVGQLFQIPKYKNLQRRFIYIIAAPPSSYIFMSRRLPAFLLLVTRNYTQFSYDFDVSLFAR